jgi:putative membrane protein
MLEETNMSRNFGIAAGALLLTLAGAAATWAADDSSSKFIKEAIQGNLAEVKVGQLAQEKGGSQGVKDFGATLVKDHQAANQSAMRIAQQMSVTPPDAPSMKQKAVYTKLSALSGDRFDREFAKSMVKDHKEDIAKYQQEAQHSDAAAGYAKETLPKLHEHLKMAEALPQSSK